MINEERIRNIPKYSLSKCKKILKTSYTWYKNKGNTLPPQVLKTFEHDLEALDKAILEEDTLKSSQLAETLEDFTKKNFRKTFFDYFLELVVALSLAIFIASLVRMMWFEPYEIPTGSMRPTFKEQDHLTVTKTAFGINLPFQTKHLYFDPQLIQRTSVVIFSADAIPMSDPDTTYFGIVPYKKRLIKRMVGKPGDSLYFYGGQIYGVNSQGEPIKEFLNSPWLEKIEYVPFLSFEGDLSTPSRNIIQFEQMHQPIGRLINQNGSLTGEIYNGNEWAPDQPEALKAPHDHIKSYGDYLGMRNYAMARLLTKEELNNFEGVDKKNLGEGLLYLQLFHDPSLTYPKPTIHNQLKNQFAFSLTPHSSIIPLNEKHLKALMDNMYTARFLVKDGVAYRYSVPQSPPSHLNPHFTGIPNGKYEFYYGKGYKVGWGGITWGLPSNHPLYSSNPKNIQNLFNFGIDMNIFVAPTSESALNLPHRYAYFRNGDLYLLGAPIIKKEDPALISFNENEEKKEKNSSASKPYIAFKDHGPPLKDGKYDVDFIRAFGITVTPKHYLVLGDNHAMSSDSRVFGFVPEENLQGAPSLILWPPGARWGFPAQKPYPIFVLPRLIVWGIVILIGIICYVIYQIRMKRPVYKKIVQ